MMTLAEYERVPNPPEGFWELYHGELVKAPFREAAEMKAAYRVRVLLSVGEGDLGIVHERVPFCPLPEYECWAADVAYVSKQRWQSAEDWLRGAPELVVQLVSASQSVPTLLDKARICLANGNLEFWIVDLERRYIRVLTSEGEVMYGSDQRISLFFGGEIAVREIFG